MKAIDTKVVIEILQTVLMSALAMLIIILEYCIDVYILMQSIERQYDLKRKVVVSAVALYTKYSPVVKQICINLWGVVTEYNDVVDEKVEAVVMDTKIPIEEYITLDIPVYQEAKDRFTEAEYEMFGGRVANDENNARMYNEDIALVSLYGATVASLVATPYEDRESNVRIIKIGGRRKGTNFKRAIEIIDEDSLLVKQYGVKVRMLVNTPYENRGEILALAKERDLIAGEKGSPHLNVPVYQEAKDRFTDEECRIFGGRVANDENNARMYNEDIALVNLHGPAVASLVATPYEDRESNVMVFDASSTLGIAEYDAGLKEDRALVKQYGVKVREYVATSYKDRARFIAVGVKRDLIEGNV